MKEPFIWITLLCVAVAAVVPKQQVEVLRYDYKVVHYNKQESERVNVTTKLQWHKNSILLEEKGQVPIYEEIEAVDTLEGEVRLYVNSGVYRVFFNENILEYNGVVGAKITYHKNEKTIRI